MILNDIQTFLTNLFESLGSNIWDYIFFIGLGFIVLLAIFFIITSSFSYEMRMVRKLLKLNNWLNRNQYINSNNLLEFNNLMKKTPKLMRYYWHQYMLYRDKEPSFYLSMYNLIEKPMKTSSFVANIKNFIALTGVFSFIAFFWGLTGLSGEEFTFYYLTKVLATPFVMIFIAVIFLLIMRKRQSQNLSAFYQYLHYYNRFMDKAITTMPDYVDFEVLFTRKEIKKGISVLNEYLEKRARQEQEELEKARLNAVEHENFDFSEAGMDGALVLERAIKETETYLNIRTRLLTEIQQLEDEIDSIKRNYENTQKDYQKKMQVSKENISRLRKQQEETTNRIENNYIKKQQADEIKKQEQLEKDNDNATLRFNQELESLTTEIDSRRKELEEKRQYVEDAMKSEYQTFSTKMYKNISQISEEKHEKDKTELIELKEEVANELDEANQKIIEKDNEIKELKDIIESHNISIGDNGGFYSEKLQKETKRVKRGKKNMPIDASDSDKVIWGTNEDEQTEELPIQEQELENEINEQENAEEFVQPEQEEYLEPSQEEIEPEQEEQFASEQEFEPIQEEQTEPEQEEIIESEQEPMQEEVEHQQEELEQEITEEPIQTEQTPEQVASDDEEEREYGEDGGWFDKDGYYRYENGAYFDPDGRFFDEFGGWYETDGITYHEPEILPEEEVQQEDEADYLNPTNDEEYREYGGDGGWFDKDGYYRYENGSYFDPEGKYFDEFGGWFELDGITYHEPENKEQAKKARQHFSTEPKDELYEDIEEEKLIDREADQIFENNFGTSENEISNKEISEQVLPHSAGDLYLYDNQTNEEEIPNQPEEYIEPEIEIPKPERKELSKQAIKEIDKLKKQFAIDDNLFIDENEKPVEVELDENGAYFDSEGNYVYPGKGWYDTAGNFHDENGGWYDAQTQEYHEPVKETVDEEDPFFAEEDPFFEEEQPEEEQPEGNEETLQPQQKITEPQQKITEPEEENVIEQEEEKETVEPSPRKAGRPRKENSDKPKPAGKRGRPRKEKTEEPVKEKKQRGRPRKVETNEDGTPKRKAGRPKKVDSQKKSVKKGRGRPRKTDKQIAEIKPAGKRGRPKKEETEKKSTGKRGRPRKNKALKEKKQRGRPRKENLDKPKPAGKRGRPKKLNDLEKLNKQIENENKKLAKHQEQLNKQLDETLSQLAKKNKN